MGYDDGGDDHVDVVSDDVHDVDDVDVKGDDDGLGSLDLWIPGSKMFGTVSFEKVGFANSQNVLMLGASSL